MARYDRIAPLPAPSRDRAFPCWPVLQDCELHPRDADAARRARLRFISLRPLARVVMQAESLQRASLLRQIDVVNEELSQLPARDAERALLRHFTQALQRGEVDGIVKNAIEVAEYCLENAAPAAADEFARWSLALAQQWKCEGTMAAATRVLARVHIMRGAAPQALVMAEQACELATAAAERGEWLRGVAVWAAAHHANGENERARDVLLQALRRAKDWRDDELIGIAYAHLCIDALEAQQFDAAVEYGGLALRTLEAGSVRGRVLLSLGLALTRLDLWRAAERCFNLAQSSSDAGTRACATGGIALCAGHDHDAARFTDRRAAALRELNLLPVYPRAEAHIVLGRAAILSGMVDLARDHLREAMALLGETGPATLRQRAERVLNLLEHHADSEMKEPVQPATDQTRRMVGELERNLESSLPAK